MTIRLPFVETIRARLVESPIVYRLARGAFWSLVGGIASRALTMASSIVAARLLGREGYGEMGIVQSTMGMFGVFAGFGLGVTATKYIAEFKTKDPTRAGRIANLTIVISLIAGGLIALVCLGMSGWLADKTLNRADLASLLGAGSLLLFISTLGGVLSAALSGFEAFREIARINIWQGVAAPLITVPCVWFYGVQGAVEALTINAALGVVLSAYALRNECNKYGISYRFDRSVWSELPLLGKFAVPSVISGALFVPVTWICNTILVNQPQGYGALGLFNVASQWQAVIIFLPSLLTAAMLPIFSETHGREDQSDFRKTLSLNLRITLVIALPVTIMIISLSEPLAALYGKQFYGAAPIIRILMISCFFYIINGVVGVALVGSGRIWVGTAMNLSWGIVLVTACLILTPLYGGMGLAMAYLLAYLLHTIWQLIYVEYNLVPSAVYHLRKILLFSVIVLSCVVANIFFMYNSLLPAVILSLMSLTPLIITLKESPFFRKAQQAS